MTFDNFAIRPICIEDSSKYHLFVDQNKSRLTKYFPKTLNANKDISSTTDHVVERLRLAEKREFFTFIILDNLLDKIVGTIFIKDLDWTVPKGELGFFIDKDYEGKGIITKAVSIISRHCFQSMGLNKVFMRIAEDNVSSRRVAEKNEFKVEGVLRKDFKTSEGKLIDVMYYGLIN